LYNKYQKVSNAVICQEVNYSKLLNKLKRDEILNFKSKYNQKIKVGKKCSGWMSWRLEETSPNCDEKKHV